MENQASMKLTDLQKALWLLGSLADAVENSLARRIGEEAAAQYCLGIQVALSELDSLRRELDRLDALDMDYPGHRRFWKPFPEV